MSPGTISNSSPHRRRLVINSSLPLLHKQCGNRRQPRPHRGNPRGEHLPLSRTSKYGGLENQDGVGPGRRWWRRHRSCQQLLRFFAGP